jgi:hypothetical protein
MADDTAGMGAGAAWPVVARAQQPAVQGEARREFTLQRFDLGVEPRRFTT